MTATPTPTPPATGETTRLGPTPEQQIAEMLGGGSAEEQMKQLQELLIRVQIPPVPILILFDPVTGRANIHEPSGTIPPEGIMNALGAAQQALSSGMLRERAQAAQAAQQSTPKSAKRGRR